MKTPEQLKGAIRSFAESRHLQPQEVLQMFFFERILDRLSMSEYRNHFILKGGLLISSMIGISERTTMDMDATVRGIHMSEEDITRIITTILSIDAGDGIIFTMNRIKPIRENFGFDNYRIFLEAIYGKIHNPMKIDITSGDEIIPDAIQYQFPLLFEDRSVPVMAYAVETILAEKYEAIISRNITTTRARDFYDIYTLLHIYKKQLRIPVLKQAVTHTASSRGSLTLHEEWHELIEEMREEPSLRRVWQNYINENPYAASLSFDDVLNAVDWLGRRTHE